MSETPQEFFNEVCDERGGQSRANDERLDKLLARDGFRVVGYLWQRQGGEYCLTTMGRHRFLSHDEYLRLMARRNAQ